VSIAVCRIKFSAEPRLLLGIARIYDALNDPLNAIVFYKRVLALDASNVESIACLGAHFFYTDQVCLLVMSC
jgi:tetratricopeptide repeat protein 8